MIKIIVAKASNNVIGDNNNLIWHLPNDLKHFKILTTNYPIIMGRKTYLSLGKPLPNRTNIVITRDKDFTVEGVEVVNSLKEAINKAKTLNKDFYIIGGGQVYKQAMEFADELYVTEVHHDFEGDTFFPEIDEEIFEETKRENYYKDEKHSYAYSFVTYKRKNN